jgi:hypothetical protein
MLHVAEHHARFAHVHARNYIMMISRFSLTSSPGKNRR